MIVGIGRTSNSQSFVAAKEYPIINDKTKTLTKIAVTEIAHLFRVHNLIFERITLGAAIEYRAHNFDH